MNSTEEDQEKFLDEALNNVRIQSFHIRKTIENSNLRQCLKETSTMLNELKTSSLSPRNYYQLYTTVFDQMQYVEQAFKEEHRRGRKISSLYESVQQASGIIPRIYLSITVGSVYIQSLEIKPNEMLKELIGMIKGVQNPLRGLFGRYYLLKMIKDKLPDVGNEYIGEGGSVEDSSKFILQNLEEMNRLWIRLSMGCTGNEKLQRIKERNELKVLVGENIIRLSSLEGLTLEMYKNDVLPNIISILLDSKDMLSQYYLMECIIFAFPNDYNTLCMNVILDTCTKLLPTVDIKSLLINLMDKLSKIIGESKETESILNDNIFELLRQNIDKIILDQSNLDKLKLLELLAAFMKFTLKCNPNKIEYVNHILSSACNILSKEIGKISFDGIKIIVKLLSSPLESLVLAIFKMNQYPILMNYLDFSSRKTLSLRIVESLNKLKDKLNSSEKISILLEFIKSLLEDSPDSFETEPIEFEYEMQNVAKLIYLVNETNVNLIITMYSQLKSIFFKGGIKRMKYTIPPLISAYLLLIAKLSYGFWATSNTEEESKAAYFNNFIDVEIKFENESEYIAILKKLYVDINECIKPLILSYPEMAFRLNLLALHNVNDLRIGKDNFSDTGRLFCENSIVLFNDEIGDQETKLSCLYQLIGSLCEINLLDKENYITFVNSLISSTSKISKRSDQCVATLACSNLYWNRNIEDHSKAKETLNKAKRFAEYSMTIPQNLNLFVLILNKYLYFIEKGVNFIDGSMLNDVVEVIKNHVQTIKSENINASFLPDIEKYFEKTMDNIKNRSKDRPILKEVIQS